MAKSGFYSGDETPQDPSTKSSFYPDSPADVEQVEGSFFEDNNNVYVEVAIAEAVGDLVGDAQAAATAAAASETAAAGSASNAAQSASDADADRIAAQAAAAAAATSETNASNSASAASASASSASTSASNASTSATNAANSASAASASALSASNAAAGWSGASSTSVAIGTGSKSFTASTGKLWVVGVVLQIASASAPTNYMHGVVTAYNSGTGALTVNVLDIGGSGTLADWNVTLAGTQGPQGPAGTVTDGDKGDITVSSSGTAFTIDAQAVTYAKIQNVSAQYRVLGRTSVGTGSIEEISTLPAQVMPAFTGGDVTSSAGSLALTIGNAKVTYAKIQNVSATDKLLGRATAGAGSVEEITCTPFARTILDDADASTARGTLGLVIGTNVQAYSANLTTLASLGNWKVVYTNGSGVPVALSVGALGTVLSGQGVAAAPAFTSSPEITTIELGHASDTTLARSSSGNVSIEGNIIYRAGGTDVPVTDGGTGASDAATARTNLGLVIGTNVQAYDAELAAIAGLTSAADKLPYFTGSGTAALTDLSSFARTLLDDADAATARTTLGVTSIGARAYRSTTQIISGGGFTKLQFDAETYDTHGCYDSSTNYRFTPTVAGYYLVIIVVSTQAVGGQTPQLVIYKNGSRYSAGEYFSIDSIYCDLMTMDIVYLNGSTDYVEGYIWTADASYIDGGSDYDFISIARIGA